MRERIQIEIEPTSDESCGNCRCAIELSYSADSYCVAFGKTLVEDKVLGTNHRLVECVMAKVK